VWSEPLSNEAPNLLCSQEEKNKKLCEVNYKLDSVKKALISILIANNEGVSLAQLPAYIK